MVKNKGIIALALVLLMCLTLLAACGGSGGGAGGSSGGSGSSGTTTGGGTTSGGSTSPGGTTVGSGSPVVSAPTTGANFAEHIDIIVEVTQITVVNTWMPAGTGAPTTWTNNMVHDRMLDQPLPGEFAPQLAKKWETEDYRTFRLELRDDVYFHNGDHFTAEDVKWNIEAAWDVPGSPANSSWGWVEKVTVIDPYTIELYLRETNTDFFYTLSGQGTSILSKRAHDESPDDPSWAWIGTGPYRITSFLSNDHVTVERTDSYWGEQPPTKSMTLWSIPDMSTRMVMLQNGEAQMAFAMNPEDLDKLAEDPDFQLFTLKHNAGCILGFNNQGDEIMMDHNFRLAIAHGINTVDIAMVANGRWAEPPSDGNVWGDITPFRLGQDELPMREYDPALAKEYLAKSVYKGEEIEVMAATDAFIRAAEMLQIQLLDIGIKTRVEIMDHGGFVDAHTYDPESKRQLHVFAIGLSQSLSGLRTAFYPGRFTNRLNTNVDFLTERIDTLAYTSDPATRERIAHEVQHYLYDDLTAIMLYWRLEGAPAVKGVGGIRWSSHNFDISLRGIYWDLNETPPNRRP